MIRSHVLTRFMTALALALVAPPVAIPPQGALPSGDAPARPGDAYGAFLEASGLLAEGDEEGARALLERVVAADPTASLAHSLLARLCLRVGDRDCAIDHADRAVTIAPAEADGHKVLAEIALGDYRQRADAADLVRGLAHLDRAAKAEPLDLSVWIAWIRVLGAERRFDEAEQIVRRAVAVPGIDAAAPVMALVRMLVAGGREEQALALLGDLRVEGRSEVPLLEMLADLRGAQGDTAGQAEALARLREHRPADPKLAHALARARLESGDPYGALEPLESALAVRPDDAEIRVDLSRALVALGRGGEADAAIEALPEALRARQPVLHLWARSAEQAGLPDRAAARYEALFDALDTEQKESVGAALRFRAAEQWLVANEPERALRVLDALPADTLVTRLRLRALDRSGKSEEASAVLRGRAGDDLGLAAVEAERVLERDGEDAAISVALRALRHAEKKPRAAVGLAAWLSSWGHVTLAAKIVDAGGMPEFLDAEVMRGRAAVLHAAGRLGEAEAAYRHLLELDPEDHPTQNDLGYLLAESGRKLPEAVALIERALQARPEEPAYLDSLGYALHRSGRSREALPLLREAARRSGPSQLADIREHLGDVYFALGDIVRARAEWEAAMRLGSSSVERLASKLAKQPAQTTGDVIPARER